MEAQSRPAGCRPGPRGRCEDGKGTPAVVAVTRAATEERGRFLRNTEHRRRAAGTVRADPGAGEESPACDGLAERIPRSIGRRSNADFTQALPGQRRGGGTPQPTSRGGTVRRRGEEGMARRGRTMPLRRSDAGSTPPEGLAKGGRGSAPGARPAPAWCPGTAWLAPSGRAKHGHSRRHPAGGGHLPPALARTSSPAPAPTDIRSRGARGLDLHAEALGLGSEPSRDRPAASCSHAHTQR